MEKNGGVDHVLMLLCTCDVVYITQCVVQDNVQACKFHLQVRAPKAYLCVVGSRFRVVDVRSETIVGS